jgi:polyisoprenoid-binding protein YceI
VIAARLAAMAAGVLVVGVLGLSPWSPRALTAATATGRAAAGNAPSSPGLRRATAQDVAVRYVTEGDGNLARYRVRERLLGNELDNDAVGETRAISGSIALDRDARVVPAGSLFTVELAGLKSDKSRRDTYVRNRLLATKTYPSTRFAITEVRGLPSPLPTSGPVRFQLVGDLTIKGVTRPTTWSVSATVTGDRLTGRAATAFTFAQFQLTQPKVSVVLSVSDTVRLEYDFVMRRQAN